MTTPLPLLPSGVNFKGTFITPGDAADAYVSYDYANQFKARYDVAKALGFNCIQDQGQTQSIDGSTLTLATYLAERKQNLDGLLKTGLYYLPIGSLNPAIWGAVTLSQMITYVTADALLCSKYPNVPGYICNDEGIQSGYVTECHSLYTAVKAAVPTNFPVTCNLFYVQSGNTEWAVAAAHAAYCDFLGWNLNTGTPSGGTWSTMLSAFPNHEHWLNVGYGTSDGAFTTNFAAQNIIGTNKVRGCAIYTQEDYITGTGYGLYSAVNSGARATRISAAQTAFSSNPIKPRPPMPGSHRLNQLRQWGF